LSLNRKQVEFTRTLAYFLQWCFENDFEVIGAELYRTPAQAREYAKQGRGIVNSVHTKKLAIDLFVFDKETGKVTWDVERYAPLSAKWKQMHPCARWGGDFRNRDAVHFSFEHNGVA